MNVFAVIEDIYQRMTILGWYCVSIMMNVEVVEGIN